MYISRNVIDSIKDTIGHFEPESGGIIALDGHNTITDFFFDKEAGVGSPSYVPSRITVQRHVRECWSTPKLHFCGIVHSHPLCNQCKPSWIDVDMAMKILEANKMTIIYLIIVKGDEIRLFSVNKDLHEEVPLEIK